MNTRSLLPSLLLPGLLLCACDPEAQQSFQPIPADPALWGAAIGYRSKATGPVGVLHERPLLTILLNYADRSFSANHDAALFSNLVEGPSFPNARDFFLENSNNRFTVKNAGVLGPYRRPGRNTADYTEATIRAEAIRLAFENGFDFSAYDTNHNGIIELGQELLLLVITPALSPTDVGAAVRGIGNSCVAVGSVCVIGSAAGLSEFAGFATLVHELSHLFGAYDLYGPWASPYITNNYQLSVMGVTGTNALNDRWTVHHDPFHKIAFGWVDPDIILVQNGAQCRLMSPPQEGGRPIALLFEDRGTSEYYLLEYRQYWGNSSQPHYDKSVVDTGLATYYVKQNSPGVPSTRISYIVPHENEALQARPDPMNDDILSLNLRDGTPQAIFAGPNHQIDTAPQGRDIGALEATVLAVGPVYDWSDTRTLTATPGRFGDSGVWSPGPWWSQQLEWPGTGSAGVRIRIGEVTHGDLNQLAVAISDEFGNFPEEFAMHDDHGLFGEEICFKSALAGSASQERVSPNPMALARPRPIPVLPKTASCVLD